MARYYEVVIFGDEENGVSFLLTILSNLTIPSYRSLMIFVKH
jgi:hypothetical protein